MKNKLLSLIITACIFAGGVLTDRAFTAVRAGSWDGLVYSINGASGDANGNVNVSAVNGHTVNSDVPANADFAQYDQNTADITAIENALNGLTATAENVASGYTFVGNGGSIETGTLNYDTRTSIFQVDKQVKENNNGNSKTYTITKPGTAVITVAMWAARDANWSVNTTVKLNDVAQETRVLFPTGSSGTTHGWYYNYIFDVNIGDTVSVSWNNGTYYNTSWYQFEIINSEINTGTICGFATKTESLGSQVSTVWAEPLFSTGISIDSNKYFVIDDGGEYTIFVSCYGDNYTRKVYVNDVETYSITGTVDTGVKTFTLSPGDKVSVSGFTDKSSPYSYCSVAAFLVKN